MTSDCTIQIPKKLAAAITINIHNTPTPEYFGKQEQALRTAYKTGTLQLDDAIRVCDMVHEFYQGGFRELHECDEFYTCLSLFKLFEKSVRALKDTLNTV